MAEIKRRTELFGRNANPQAMMAINAKDASRLADLNVNEVRPDPNNPRKIFDEDELIALADSIKQNGLLQPILVRKVANEFHIIAGERRWRATKLAGFASIKSIIQSDNRNPTDLLIAQIVENEVRANLTTGDLIDAVKSLIELGLQSSEIANRLSMPRPKISKLKVLGDLPKDLEHLRDTMGIEPLYELFQKHKNDAEGIGELLSQSPAPTRSEIRVNDRNDKSLERAFDKFNWQVLHKTLGGCKIREDATIEVLFDGEEKPRKVKISDLNL